MLKPFVGKVDFNHYLNGAERPASPHAEPLHLLTRGCLFERTSAPYTEHRQPPGGPEDRDTDTVPRVTGLSGHQDRPPQTDLRNILERRPRLPFQLGGLPSYVDVALPQNSRSFRGACKGRTGQRWGPKNVINGVYAPPCVFRTPPKWRLPCLSPGGLDRYTKLS